MTSSNETASRDIAIANDYDDGKIVSDEIITILKAVNVAVFTQAFDVLGTVTNIINAVVFVRIGFSETINISLMALAVSDFGACFLLIWRAICLNPLFQQIDDLPFEPNEFSYLISTWPHIYFAKVSTLLTAFVSVERCLCVTMPLKVKFIVTKRKVKLFIFCSFVSTAVVFLVPLYLTQGYDWKFFPHLNKTLIGLVGTADRFQIESFVFPLVDLVFSILPFIIISISTAFLVVSLKESAKWRRATKSDATKSKISTKESKVVKMVVVMSSLFIFCLFPHTVALLMKAVDRDIAIDGKNSNLLFAFGSFLFLLESVNSSCNIFIYYYNSSVYKTTFRQIFCKGNSNDS